MLSRTRYTVIVPALLAALALLPSSAPALADGGSGGGAPECASVGIAACDVLGLSAGSTLDAEGPTVNVYGYDLVQLYSGGYAALVSGGDAEVHADGVARVRGQSGVEVQANGGDLSLVAITGAVAIPQGVTLTAPLGGRWLLSVDDSGALTTTAAP